MSYKKKKKKKFSSVLPPEPRSKRTVLIFNVGEHIFNHTEEDIKEEINRRNEWLDQGIDNLLKFKNKNISKIQFKQSLIAKRTIENGILAYNMSIPAYNIKQEEYINIKTCRRCYKINTHYTTECPEGKTYKICSECGNNGHEWRECKETIKKCINCGWSHRTLAYKRPKRREMREEIIKEQKEPEMTYSQVTNKNTVFPDIPKSTINSETHAKIFKIMLHAHFMNIATPGTYEEQLNKTLKANNLPTINIPECPPSQIIIANSIQAQDLEQPTQNPTREEQQEKVQTSKTEWVASRRGEPEVPRSSPAEKSCRFFSHCRVA